MQSTDLDNFVIVDDQGNTDMIYDIADRIFELQDELSLDIVARNITEKFNNPATYETINYITKFKEKYVALKEQSTFDGDLDILNRSLQEIGELVLANLNSKFFVGIGNELDDDLTMSTEEYLDNIETLYNFFVVRHYTNIRDFFKAKLMKNKVEYIEKYKMALDDKTYDDLFLSQDKKKFRDVSDAIIIHFITDIINDIRSEIFSAYMFFDDIIDMDLFEEYNDRMRTMIANYGNDIVFVDDGLAAQSYLNILDNDEIFVTLRNDLLSIFLADAPLAQ